MSMLQQSLFSTNPQVAGFKLDYMEIWNWGTFDGNIYRMNPQGNNSLLTGANASGKSTLIDALLTLLVPLKRQRFYNQSSGADKKGNRTELSYFFGNYGQQQDENSGITSLKLRGKDARSVLLATFTNVDNRIVTLFQVRYYTGEELKVVFGIANTPLSIKADFTEFDIKGVWRKHLEKEYNSNNTRRIIEFFDGPMAYEQKILQMFGMRSEKALTLFNQIVGVKVLDDLSTFIRDNMLEELPAENKYLELKSNFQNLIEAKTNIDKTKEQIQLLVPIDGLAKELKEIDRSIGDLKHEKETAAFWFASRTVQLCDDKLSYYKQERKSLKDEIKKLEKQREELDDQKSNLDVAIKTDTIGQQIKDLEKDISQLSLQRDTRKANSDTYTALARQLGLLQEPDASGFNANSTKSKEEKDYLKRRIDKDLSEDKRHLQNALEDIENNIKHHVETISYLQEHNNNISGRVAEIRDEILRHIGATTDEIPFIGELISVKDNQREWEFAIEHILHNFALRLIVPEKYYQKVNEYVNGHNLQGRIVYHRYNGTDSLREFESRYIPENSLLNKIDLKSKCQYIDWIEDRLFSEYNYSCVDSLIEFNHIKEKVVTKAGLIKSKWDKHEKDDRQEIHRKDNYVLGWDNHEKIAALRKEYEDLRTQKKNKNTELDQLNNLKEELENKIEAINQLLKYEKYDEIDWQSYAQTINEKDSQKQQLEKSNNRLKTLQEQFEQVKLSINNLNDQHNSAIGKLALIEEKENQTQKIYDDNAQALAIMDWVDTTDFESKYPDLQFVELVEIDAKRNSIQNKIEETTKIQLGVKYNKEGECKDKIRYFKHPSDEITAKYKDWQSDVSRLPDSLEFISEYQDFLLRLKNDDLPSFEGKFNKYLQETITNNVSAFRMFFQNWESSINKTIDQLNSYLKDIDFNTHPNTYIQLVSTRIQNVEINEFRRLLSEAIPNLREVESTIDGKRIHFEQHIEPLMQRLQDEQWRANVMDVRTWFSYKAVEFYKADDMKHNTYDSMGQLSGGEKAQLTYTILGSAIAYQFGLTKQGTDSSFRFIAIDEAFRAQDEDKARYLISLCKQLHLQLLVVTPSDNIHIVENDISYVHYVERKGNTSILFNMPINQFKEERQKSIESE